MVHKLTKHVELVPNWKKCWKWASVQISAVGLLVFSGIDVIQNSFNVLPPHLLKEIPHGSNIALALFALNIVGRLIRLKPKGDPDAS